MLRKINKKQARKKQPELGEGLSKFKFEVASELGVQALKPKNFSQSSSDTRGELRKVEQNLAKNEGGFK